MKSKALSLSSADRARRFRIKLLLCTSLVLALMIGFSAAYAQNLRMEPAQRQLVDGPQMSQRDMARSQFRRSEPIRGRGRAYDEVLSARDTAFWQKKGKSKSAKRAKRTKRAKRNVNKVKTSN